MTHNFPNGDARVRYEHPPVHVNSRGVCSINPADLLRSTSGLSEIRKAAEAARVRQANGRGGKK